MTTHVGVRVTFGRGSLDKTFLVDDFSGIFVEFKNQTELRSLMRKTERGRHWHEVDGMATINFKEKVLTLSGTNPLWYDWNTVKRKLYALKNKGWKITIMREDYGSYEKKHYPYIKKFM